MRLFLDTNVLLSAFYGNGLCSELMQALLEGGYTLLVGEPVMREFIRISREKFRVGQADLSWALEVLRCQELVPAGDCDPDGIPDPDDVPIIACALASRARLFVTGDQALLELERVGQMRIVSPRTLYEEILSAR